MTDIEIPQPNERTARYRFFEMLPGLVSWSILLLPFVLSQISPRITVLFIIAYLLLWFAKAIGLNMRVLQGWRTMQKQQKLDWTQLLKELETGAVDEHGIKRPQWHYNNLKRLAVHPPAVEPSELYHAVIVATYNEGKAVLEPTIQSILDSHYDMKKIILVIAYEGRDGAQSEQAALELINEYGDKFKHAFATKHPLTPGEIRGKGGNVTYAGRELLK